MHVQVYTWNTLAENDAGILVIVLQGLWKPSELCISGFFSEGLWFTHLFQLVITVSDSNILYFEKLYVTFDNVLVIVIANFYSTWLGNHLRSASDLKAQVMVITSHEQEEEQNLMSYWISVSSVKV